MAATRQTVGDGISRTFAISRAPDNEHRTLGAMEFSRQIRFPVREGMLWHISRGTLSVSIGEIEEDIVGYFVRTMGASPSSLTPATDVRKMFSFSGAAWAQLADTLSNQPWMLHIGVRLVSADMMTVSTIAQISPNFSVSPQLLQEARAEDLRKKASSVAVSQISMTEAVQPIFKKPQESISKRFVSPRPRHSRPGGSRQRAQGHKYKL